MRRLVTIAVMALLSCSIWAQDKPASLIRVDSKEVGDFDWTNYYIVVTTDLNTNEKSYRLLLSGSINDLAFRYYFEPNVAAELISVFRYLTTVSFEPPARWESTEIICNVSQDLYFKLDPTNRKKRVDLMVHHDLTTDSRIAEIQEDEYAEYGKIMNDLEQIFKDKGCQLEVKNYSSGN